MLPDVLHTYLLDIETNIQELENANVERYEEEIFSDDRVNLRIRIRFANGELLELNEAIASDGKQISHLNYRYHFQDNQQHLIF